jgi:oxaloacetate decarboxylase gamma subunit
MDSSNLVNEGLTLMLFGIGFVFVFLTLLVFATSLMSWVITKIEKNVGVIPDEGVPAPTSFVPNHETSPVQANQVEDTTLISVLSAAVHKFRSNKK